MIDPMTTTDGAKPTCRVIGAGEEVVGKQGHPHAPGISAQSAGALIRDGSVHRAG